MGHFDDLILLFLLFNKYLSKTYSLQALIELNTCKCNAVDTHLLGGYSLAQCSSLSPSSWLEA